MPRAEAEAPRIAPSAEIAAERESGPSWMSELLDSHVRLTLSYPLLAGIAVGVLVLLAVSFETGRRFGAPATGAARDGDSALPVELTGAAPPSTTDTGTVQLPNRPDPVDSQRSEAVAPPVPKPSERGNEAAKPKDEPRPVVKLQSGMSYIQVQIFGSKERKRAEAAADFLIRNGVDACLLDRKVDIVVLATQPFNLAQKDAAARKREQTAADALVKQIRKLGEEYRKIAGYRFEFAEPREFK